MRTDTIFYQLFQTFPSLLFELIEQPPDLAQRYEFSSREIKELARRFDGLFLPPEAIFEQPIYFVEVQFQKKTDFYWRFFTEIFAYLGQYQPENDWLAVAIFAQRSLDPEIPRQYRGLILSQQVKLVYLDELEETAEESIGLGIVQLVVGDEQVAVQQTNQLMERVRQEQVEDVAWRRKVIDLIERILVYKFTELSHQEIEAMFHLSDLKQTRVYQEAKLEGKLEGKLESVPGLLAIGLSVEQVAKALGLDIEVVRQASLTVDS